MKGIITVLAFAILAGAASASKPKDHSADYQVGVLQSTEQVNTGAFVSCDHGCISQSTGHNVHFVVTPEGVYTIAAPTSAGLTILQGMFASPNLPPVHIQWFMDDLHEGDKVLLYAKCDKHNNCEFWIPKPDQPGKEYTTTGWFRPRVAQTNTTQLCGTGKLTPAVEAQVCPATAPTTTPVAEPTTTDAPVAETYPANELSKSNQGMEAFRQGCNSGTYPPSVLPTCSQYFPPTQDSQDTIDWGDGVVTTK